MSILSNLSEVSRLSPDQLDAAVATLNDPSDYERFSQEWLGDTQKAWSDIKDRFLAESTEPATLFLGLAKASEAGINHLQTAQNAFIAAVMGQVVFTSEYRDRKAHPADLTVSVNVEETGETFRQTLHFKFGATYLGSVSRTTGRPYSRHAPIVMGLEVQLANAGETAGVSA